MSYDYRFGSWQLKGVHPLTAFTEWTHLDTWALGSPELCTCQREGKLSCYFEEPSTASCFKKMEDGDGF